MSKYQSSNITQRLDQWNCRDPQAWDELLPQVYGELRKKAHQLLSKHQQQTLQPTALVHELYFDFKNLIDTNWKNRQHFFAVVALAMRQIIINNALKKKTAKRGGNLIEVTYVDDDLIPSIKDRTVDFLDLDKALEEMDSIDPLACRIVELRTFAGLTVPEAAEVLEASERNVYRKWMWAKTWLFARLNPLDG